MPKEKIHYIYKIYFLCGQPEGRYYLGKRTYSGKDINKDREKVIIGDLWKTDPLCMNQKHGGDGGAIEGHAVSDEFRKKVSMRMKGNKHNVGRKHTPEAKEKDRIAHLGNKYGLGHKMTDENKQRLIESNEIKVYQYDLNGVLINEFDSVKEASNKTGVCRTKISSCCSGSRLTSGGFIWKNQKIEISTSELEQIKSNTKFKSKDKRAVYKIDKITGEKTRYVSVREAARQNNIQNSSIYAVCSGKRCTAGGYEWKFAKED